MSATQRKVWSWVLVGVALAVALAGCGLVEDVQDARQVGNDFMTALKEGDYEAAYALFVVDLQQEVGSVANLTSMIEDNQAQPSEWSFSSFNVTTKEDMDEASLEGPVTYQDGREGGVELEMVKLDDTWQLVSFNLTW